MLSEEQVLNKLRRKYRLFMISGSKKFLDQAETIQVILEMDDDEAERIFLEVQGEMNKAKEGK